MDQNKIALHKDQNGKTKAGAKVAVFISYTIVSLFSQ
jgi:hypothetical protein